MTKSKCTPDSGWKKEPCSDCEEWNGRCCGKWLYGKSPRPQSPTAESTAGTNTGQEKKDESDPSR
jgi:hypothetical protein